MATDVPEFSERVLAGCNYFDRLAPLLARLHDGSRARATAGNRPLHFDHSCLLVLPALFNPTLRSLRALQTGRFPLRAGGRHAPSQPNTPPPRTRAHPLP